MIDISTQSTPKQIQRSGKAGSVSGLDLHEALACLRHGCGQQKEQYADKLRIPLESSLQMIIAVHWSEILFLSIADPAL